MPSPLGLFCKDANRKNAMWLQLYRRTVFLAALALLAPPLSTDRILAASPEQAPPQGQDPPGADDGGTKPPFEKHDGVITPPPIGDEDIHAEVPNPNAGHDEEVIPPPGTPGGDPNVDPR
jgi:hypothetical protein